MQLDTAFKTLPRPVLMAGAIVLLAIIACVDYISEWEVSLFVFYALPILFVVWYCDRKSGILMAALSMVAWWGANRLGNPYETKAGYLWAAGSRFVYFAAVAVAGAALRKQREIDAARIAALEHARALERDIVNVSEREQRRIGQDIHDGLCQVLAGIGCAVTMLKEELLAKSMPEARSAEEIEAFIQDAATEARDLARGIFPVLQDPTGLEPALEELAALTSRLHQRQVEVFYEDGITFSDPQVSMHLYRIAQEAVSNALKHSNGNSVGITVGKFNEYIRLTIQDDGPGVPASAFLSSNGMGLRTMRYRASLIGARLEIGPGPDGGTLVSCEMRPNVRIEPKEN